MLVNYSMFNMQGVFFGFCFDESRFLYRLGLSIICTSKTVALNLLYHDLNFLFSGGMLLNNLVAG